jgi:hypothetical protein
VENDDDFPIIGKDIQKWSDLDSLLPILDLDIELFVRRNVHIASLVILSGLLKSNYIQRKKLLKILNLRYFDPKSLPQYLFERIVQNFRNNEIVTEAGLEKWILEYFLQVWGETPPNERMLFGHNYTLRQILTFNPNDEQIRRAIELRGMKMEKEGY